MVRITEIKVSIHRKFTKNYNSYGYRIGVMVDVGSSTAQDAYYQGLAFLQDKMKEENQSIEIEMGKKDYESSAVNEKVFQGVPMESHVVEKVSGKVESNYGVSSIPFAKDMSYNVVERPPETVVFPVKGNSEGKEQTQINGTIIGITQKALLIDFADGKQIRVPKSTV